MSGLDAVEDALREARSYVGRTKVRKHFPLKSGNKLRVTDPASIQRQADANRNLTEFRAKYSLHEYESYVANAEVYRAANCFEYACFAHVYICKRRRNKELVSAIFETVAPSDHVICLVAADALGGHFDMHSQGDVWVCDPWLNIACHRRDYFGLVEQKLNHWGQRGKCVYWNGHWWLANDPAYVNGMKDAKYQKKWVIFS